MLNLLKKLLPIIMRPVARVIGALLSPDASTSQDERPAPPTAEAPPQPPPELAYQFVRPQPPAPQPPRLVDYLDVDSPLRPDIGVDADRQRNLMGRGRTPTQAIGPGLPELFDRLEGWVSGVKIPLRMILENERGLTTLEPLTPSLLDKLLANWNQEDPDAHSDVQATLRAIQAILSRKQDDQPPTCPQGGEPVYKDGQWMCMYEYQREEAVNYALRVAARAIDRFIITYNYPGGKMPKWVTDDPRYTDCANSVSQALFQAGFPLTSGWSVAKPKKGDAEKGFEDYYVGEGAWASALLEGGLPAYIDRLDDTPAVEIYSRLWNELKELRRTGDISASETAAAMREHVMEDENMRERLQVIEAGDIMYWEAMKPNEETGKLEKVAHTAMVVGWGPPVEDWNQLSEVLAQNPELSPEYQEGFVPYIVDHGPQGDVYKGQQRPEFTRPRPYYLLWQPITVDGALMGESALYEGGQLGFIHIPSEIYIEPGQVLQEEYGDLQEFKQSY